MDAMFHPDPSGRGGFDGRYHGFEESRAGGAHGIPLSPRSDDSSGAAPLRAIRCRLNPRATLPPLAIGSIAQLLILVPASLALGYLHRSVPIALGGSAASVAIYLGGVTAADVLLERSLRYRSHVKTK